MTRSLLPRRALLKSALALPFFGVGGCIQRSETYRFRLTVEVETSEGLRTGSTVLEATKTQTSDSVSSIPGLGGTSSTHRGEAVAVELPNGQVLFTLLSAEGYPEGTFDIPYFALQPERPESEYDFIHQTEAMKRIDGVHPVPRILPPLASLDERSGYPVLVTFKDIDDPTSVQLVDPDDLAATFGPGYALKRITVQMTDDPVTRGIEDRLGWLKESADGGLDKTLGVRAQPTLAQRLSFLDFRRE